MWDAPKCASYSIDPAVLAEARRRGVALSVRDDLVGRIAMFETALAARRSAGLVDVLEWHLGSVSRSVATAEIEAWNMEAGVAPRSLGSGAERLLVGLRDDVGARRFVPQRVRQRTIPKSSGKVRSLGIPTVADRVVQASLKLVLETIISGRNVTRANVTRFGIA